LRATAGISEVNSSVVTFLSKWYSFSPVPSTQDWRLTSFLSKPLLSLKDYCKFSVRALQINFVCFG
jgi:hypothetical protein